ncbi:hypothetical protein H9623_19140 [Oerskovia sp. Sa1BUA8]|uniref:Uncharacterized protein n=1 Tax=Oerskovia douganii TaxID=2762210 RepID=A0A9D5UC60_9CELL|nr:alpha amylase C-terminal domain-containing protein [Oerskovia douganii]MBE7702408.1 hypothetical protein [Oerskovia douganii]
MRKTRSVLAFCRRSDLELFVAINGDTAPAERDKARRNVLIDPRTGLTSHGASTGAPDVAHRLRAESHAVRVERLTRSA